MSFNEGFGNRKNFNRLEIAKGRIGLEDATKLEEKAIVAFLRHEISSKKFNDIIAYTQKITGSNLETP